MPNLSQETIRELRQSLPVLQSLRGLFASRVAARQQDRRQLERAYNQVAELTSHDQIYTWVGDAADIEHIPFSLADRLLSYVQGIVESQKTEETLNRLIKDNTDLREQLAELSQQEQTYSSLLSEAQTATSYEVPPESALFLFQSKQRQHTIFTKKLGRLQETRAQYGLDTPPHILEDIDQTQEQIRQIEANIADWKDKINWM